ncbi:MAG: TonB family protein [Bacteroidetes bacterium]|nr:TonB family protein [Bacteroidota bacterium]
MNLYGSYGNEELSSREKKDRLIAAVAAIVLHALLLLALLFLALRTPLPLPAEQGVEVNLGYADQGMGRIQPVQESAASQAAATPTAAQPAREEFVTQNTEEAPALPERRTERPASRDLRPVRTEPAPRPQPETPPAQTPPAEPQPRVNERALFRGSGTGTTSGSEGITGQTGDQGRPDGLREVTRYDGQGGQGGGPAFSLGGRGARFLDKPGSNFREQGNVVVDIWVDKNGKVVRAEVSLRGTTIVDSNLRNQSVRAALNSSFTPDPNAPDLQRGTITYTFIIGN